MDAPVRTHGVEQTQGEEHMKKKNDGYEYKTYDMARFHIPEGLYSIEDVEKMLIHMKKTKQKTEAYLAKTLEPIKEKNT